MHPTLGWTLLSREALRKAETLLPDAEKGVRDEIGFLSLHQGYADRFFPGTSVLQTRLRYAFFVPWIYEDLVTRTIGKSIEITLRHEEVLLAGRLKATGQNGVIGGRTYPNPSVQPPSMIYWTALKTWGILKPWGGAIYPSRAMLHRALSRNRHQNDLLRDDDRHPLNEPRIYFAKLPERPSAWHNLDAPLDFQLSPDETLFLQKQLVGINRPGAPGTQSLLARLVEHKVRVAEIDAPWSRAVSDAAEPEDQSALRRARQASSLATVGRAVYAALVEYLCETEDKRAIGDIHRTYLNQVVAQHHKFALKLDISAIEQDIGKLPAGFRQILFDTQVWLKKGSSFTTLLEPYELNERLRKGRRSRLSTNVPARERRAGWHTEREPYPLAEPLHYRWFQVRRLLNDLWGDA